MNRLVEVEVAVLVGVRVQVLVWVFVTVAVLEFVEVNEAVDATLVGVFVVVWVQVLV